ncbi:hypothetical protein [Knoellia subterranea]|uniref:Uncharacterized protein n=1 Tax=Knoellia subterranea KCTC 19937 TaxID=1385521 RepID=A0A0A0JHB3_9MICO|nr:hypothetical protein [Knoellia subterranea]KGN36835.1 hypothetical protein N803_17135 [Knoellia subterranea KCTC 19937]
MEWWSAALAFIGAGVGSLVSYLVARRDIAQREAEARADVGQRVEQGHLEEWGRRFTIALDGVSSESPRRRSLSRVLLVELGQSALATDQEKALVLSVLDAGARMDGDGDDVTRFRAGMLVDEVVYVEDTGEDDDEGGVP